jgi:cytoskeletal protein CcmA (bactofilin family)
MFKIKPNNAQAPTNQVGSSLIGPGTTINGNIESGGDIRIDGTLMGNISGTAKVVLGATGIVMGDIHCNQADIQGKVTGKLKVNDMLYLRGEAIIEGDIHAGKLQIDPQVTFNGHCHMGNDAFVVEMATDEKRKAILQ